jgi:hypothetical protein
MVVLRRSRPRLQRHPLHRPLRAAAANFSGADRAPELIADNSDGAQTELPHILIWLPCAREPGSSGPFRY